MAKKKSTIEEAPTIVEPEIDYQKDIANKSFEQVAKAPVETPTEDVKEEVKPEEKPTEEFETVEFDPEALKREAIEQAKKEIQESLKAETKVETEAKKDEYDEFQKTTFEKEGRNPTYKEALEFLSERSEKRFEAKQEAKAAKLREEAEAQTKAQTVQQESTNKYIKDTLDDLYNADKLPKIADRDNPDDYGIRVQNKLYQTVVEVNTKRIQEGKPAKTLKEIFYEDFKMPEREVAGADAPINMGRAGYTPDTETEEIDYVKDLRGKSFRQIATEMARKVVGK